MHQHGACVLRAFTTGDPGVAFWGILGVCELIDVYRSLH